MVREGAVESPFANQILYFEVARVEFADGERHPSETARRDHRGDPASIGQPRVENGLRFRDVVAQTPGDILHSDHQGTLPEGHTWYLLQEALLFDKHSVGTVHHHLAD